MIAGVYLVSALLVLTKLGDVFSTLRRVRDVHSETNPIARPMMRRLGTAKAAWIVFLLALIIIAVTTTTALRGGPMMRALFIAVGTAIAVVQAAAALSNWTGRNNLISRRVLTAHSRLRGIVAR